MIAFFKKKQSNCKNYTHKQNLWSFGASDCGFLPVRSINRAEWSKNSPSGNFSVLNFQNSKSCGKKLFIDMGNVFRTDFWVLKQLGSNCIGSYLTWRCNTTEKKTINYKIWKYVSPIKSDVYDLYMTVKRPLFSENWWKFCVKMHSKIIFIWNKFSHKSKCYKVLFPILWTIISKDFHYNSVHLLTFDCSKFSVVAKNCSWGRPLLHILIMWIKIQ